jgi:hypothetical protein
MERIFVLHNAVFFFNNKRFIFKSLRLIAVLLPRKIFIVLFGNASNARSVGAIKVYGSFSVNINYK